MVNYHLGAIFSGDAILGVAILDDAILGVAVPDDAITVFAIMFYTESQVIRWVFDLLTLLNWYFLWQIFTEYFSLEGWFPAKNDLVWTLLYIDRMRVCLVQIITYIAKVRHSTMVLAIIK